MFPAGALCFLPAAFWAHVLPKWPLWAHLFYSVFYSVSELRRACFRQARVARAVLPPNEMFCAGAFALPPCAPKSHMCPLPHLGVSDIFIRCERFAQIASNLRFAILSPPKRDSKKRGSVRGTLRQFARIRRFARICESIRVHIPSVIS